MQAEGGGGVSTHHIHRSRNDTMLYCISQFRIFKIQYTLDTGICGSNIIIRMLRIQWGLVSFILGSECPHPPPHMVMHYTIILKLQVGKSLFVEWEYFGNLCWNWLVVWHCYGGAWALLRVVLGACIYYFVGWAAACLPVARLLASGAILG